MPAVIVAATVMSLSGQATEVAQKEVPTKTTKVCSSNNVDKTTLVDAVNFRTYKTDSDGACLEVIRNGKIVFRLTNDGWFTLGQQRSSAESMPGIANGTDITGRGFPDMIVSEWTGGAHCCRIDHIFELGPTVRLLTSIDAKHSDQAHFADLDDHGIYYYLADDWTFASWWGSFAGSPVEPVVLKFSVDSKDARYHLALEKMARPAPNTNEWNQALQKVKSQLALNKANQANDLPDVLWQEVLHLIYTGHSDLAWKFLEQAGPEAQRGGYPDLKVFCSTLKTSPCWPDLRAVTKNLPAACRNAKQQLSKLQS